MSLASQYKTAACGDDQKHHIPGARGRLVHRGWMLRPHKRTHKRRLRQEAPVRSVCFLFAPGGSVTVTGPHSGSFSFHRMEPSDLLERAVGNEGPSPLPSCPRSLLLEKNQKVIAWVWLIPLSALHAPSHLVLHPHRPSRFFVFGRERRGGRTPLPHSPSSFTSLKTKGKKKQPSKLHPLSPPLAGTLCT